MSKMNEKTAELVDTILKFAEELRVATSPSPTWPALQRLPSAQLCKPIVPRPSTPRTTTKVDADAMAHLQSVAEGTEVFCPGCGHPVSRPVSTLAEPR